MAQTDKIDAIVSSLGETLSRIDLMSAQIGAMSDQMELARRDIDRVQRNHDKLRAESFAHIDDKIDDLRSEVEEYGRVARGEDRPIPPEKDDE